MTASETGNHVTDTPIRGLLIDLDGVVYIGDAPIPGAVESIRRVRTQEIPVRFVTNTTTKPVSDVEQKLLDIGIEVEAGEVFTPIRAAVATMRRLGAAAPYLVVDERIASEFGSLTPAGRFPDPPSDAPDAVVVGDIGRRWDYELMSFLFELVSAGARLIALHKGRSWQTDNGLALDIGAFVAGLEYACGIEAIVTGKPSADFFYSAVTDIGVTPAEAAMIGDDIDGDIGGAQAAGIRGVLVRTGKFRRDYAERSGITPWRTLESLADIGRLPGLG